MNLKTRSISVVIACDSAPGNFQQATAIRGILEAFGVQVHFYELVQKQNVLDFLSGNYPSCDYTIWFIYGSFGTNGEEKLDFQVVHQNDSDYTNKQGWERINFSLTPSTVSEYIKNAKGTLICGAASGNTWADPFLSTGFQGYIAPIKPDLACNSYILFITGLFYHLLFHTLDYTDKKLTLQESVVAAASMDHHYEFGTQLFRHYEASEEST